MIKKSDIENAIDSQMSKLSEHKSYHREILERVNDIKPTFANIITGIRRCGKSTLVEQMISASAEHSLYLNFDTTSLFGFDIDDFAVLDLIIKERKPQCLYFDEIQFVKGWELYVRSKLDEGYKVVVTGSNASLLSRELGTKLTGRHINYTLYPFSYMEYVGYKGFVPSEDSYMKYMEEGGFPGYLLSGDKMMYENLFSDILYRDIMARYNIRDEFAIKNLAKFLICNIGNLVSASKLTQAVHIKTSKTILEYFSYLQDAYLFFFVKKFSYSYKSTLLSPRKVYSIDLGLQSAVTLSSTSDSGHRLENSVFLQLKRMGKEVFYYNEDGAECDFVVCDNSTPIQLIQVCEQLNVDNEKRELNGLVAAIKKMNLTDALIITQNQSDVINFGGILINVKPVWKWCCEISK